MFDYDAELRHYHQRLRTAIDVRPGDQVLDIGCGTGQSTCDAARATGTGFALGVDLSAPALEQARWRSDQEGLRNVGFEQADAQVHPFPPAHFDLGISRFGVMFFADPVAAFTNIGRALRPGARLVLLVWQDRDRNEWATAIHQALAGGAAALPAPAPGQDPFALGDPAVADGILTAAGFTEIRFTDVHEPVYYGDDCATACDVVLGLREPSDLLASLDPPAAEHALHRLRTTLAAHETDDGVLFDSRAWIITARRPRR
jgi:SAM-dependent methyltransferase